MRICSLILLLLFPSLSFAHGLGPNTQIVNVSKNANYFSFDIEATNMRRDVNRFYITVHDAEGTSIPFSSTNRNFFLAPETNKKIKIFVVNNEREKYRVCTWANTSYLTVGPEQKVISGVCVSVSVRYFSAPGQQ